MPLSFIKSKPKTPPVERVRELNSKGFSEIEIIDILKKEGYSPADIDIAFSQLLKESIEKEQKSSEHKADTQTTNKNPSENTQQTTEIQSTYSLIMEDYINYMDYLIQNRIAEVLNQIRTIENRYIDIEKKIEEVVSQVREGNTRSLQINREIFENISRIENKIKDISLKIESIQEILKEILPLLIDSVRSIVSLTKRQSNI
ncbi:MAG: hypothetical protein QXW01_01200 [Candidatus Aenigmatarchaeota archaeon]